MIPVSEAKLSERLPDELKKVGPVVLCRRTVTFPDPCEMGGCIEVNQADLRVIPEPDHDQEIMDIAGMSCRLNLTFNIIIDDVELRPLEKTIELALPKDQVVKLLEYFGTENVTRKPKKRKKRNV